MVTGCVVLTARSVPVFTLLIVTVPLALRPMTSDDEDPAAVVNAEVRTPLFAAAVVVLLFVTVVAAVRPAPTLPTPDAAGTVDKTPCCLNRDLTLSPTLC